MDSACIKQTICKVLNKLQHGKYLVAYVLTTSKTPFLSLLPRGSVTRYFFNFFFMYAMPIPVQTKERFKNLQFLAVTYDMGFLIFAFDVV